MKRKATIYPMEEEKLKPGTNEKKPQKGEKRKQKSFNRNRNQRRPQKPRRKEIELEAEDFATELTPQKGEHITARAERQPCCKNEQKNSASQPAPRAPRGDRVERIANKQRETKAIEYTEPANEYKEMYDYVTELPEKPAEEKTVEVVGIKFRGGGKVYYFDPIGIEFSKGDHAVVETVRGVEYGDVSLGNKLVGKSEVVFPLKPVLRKATAEDTARNAENRRLEEAARPVWEEKVRKNGLDMQLVDVEYTHDNAKLCFYFTADGRVDFRELVKDLAGVFRTRIELRQIGVRDEAKLYGGLGCCGRPFCCNTFLPDFAQVSIKMAKEQNLSLSSSKISGACGRLMCCLRFEHDTYEREYATFPKTDTIVDTPKGRGVITESNFLTGKIKVRMNGDQTIKTFVKSELKPLGTIKVKDEPVSEDLKKLEE